MNNVIAKNKQVMRIMIVDDDYKEARDIASRLKAILRGWDMYIVNKASDALSEVSRIKYAAVLIDLMLSRPWGRRPSADDETGVTILEKLQRLTPDTKFVAYTGFLDPSLDADLLSQATGADFVFKKPEPGNRFSGELARLLKDFLPSSKLPEEKPATSLILPARRAILTVNTRLAEIFRRDPDLLRTIDPFRFEELVAELFEEDGYDVVLTPHRADGGKDIYVFKSDERLEMSFLVECKRYLPPNKVGVEIARQLYGIVQHERRSGGVIVTTSYFTKGAREFAGTVPYQLFLRDFDDLRRWLEKPMVACKDAVR